MKQKPSVQLRSIFTPYPLLTGSILLIYLSLIFFNPSIQASWLSANEVIISNLVHECAQKRYNAICTPETSQPNTIMVPPDAMLTSKRADGTCVVYDYADGCDRESFIKKRPFELTILRLIAGACELDWTYEGMAFDNNTKTISLVIIPFLLSFIYACRYYNYSRISTFIKWALVLMLCRTPVADASRIYYSFYLENLDSTSLLYAMYSHIQSYFLLYQYASLYLAHSYITSMITGYSDHRTIAIRWIIGILYAVSITIEYNLGLNENMPGSVFFIPVILSFGAFSVLPLFITYYFLQKWDKQHNYKTHL